MLKQNISISYDSKHVCFVLLVKSIKIRVSKVLRNHNLISLEITAICFLMEPAQIRFPDTKSFIQTNGKHVVGKVIY